MAGRNRLYPFGVAVAGQGQAIYIQQNAGFNRTLIQVALAIRSPGSTQVPQVPTTSEAFTIGKRSGLGVIGYEFLFRSFDPAVEQLTDIVCNEWFELSRYDILLIEYPNSDDLNVLCEAVVKEVD